MGVGMLCCCVVLCCGVVSWWLHRPASERVGRCCAVAQPVRLSKLLQLLQLTPCSPGSAHPRGRAGTSARRRHRPPPRLRAGAGAARACVAGRGWPAGAARPRRLAGSWQPGDSQGGWHHSICRVGGAGALEAGARTRAEALHVAAARLLALVVEAVVLHGKAQQAQQLALAGAALDLGALVLQGAAGVVVVVRQQAAGSRSGPRPGAGGRGQGPGAGGSC